MVSRTRNCQGTNRSAEQITIVEFCGPCRNRDIRDLQCVLEVDPSAVVIDTHAAGKKDLVALAYKLFCVSNKALTKHFVYEMESRGVPAFGPIWDS